MSEEFIKEQALQKFIFDDLLLNRYADIYAWIMCRRLYEKNLFMSYQKKIGFNQIVEELIDIFLNSIYSLPKSKFIIIDNIKVQLSMPNNQHPYIGLTLTNGQVYSLEHDGIFLSIFDAAIGNDLIKCFDNDRHNQNINMKYKQMPYKYTEFKNIDLILNNKIRNIPFRIKIKLFVFRYIYKPHVILYTWHRLIINYYKFNIKPKLTKFAINIPRFITWLIGFAIFTVLSGYITFSSEIINRDKYGKNCIYSIECVHRAIGDYIDEF